MNFDFSDDQKMLKETARDYLQANAPLTVCRAVLESDAAYSETLNWVRQFTFQLQEDLEECDPTQSLLYMHGRTQAAALSQEDLEAMQAENRRDFYFRILNHTVKACPYERAVLWDLSSRKPHLLGISGQQTINPRAPLVMQWQAVIGCLKDPGSAGVLAEESFTPAGAAEWYQVQQACPERTGDCAEAEGLLYPAQLQFL